MGLFAVAISIAAGPVLAHAQDEAEIEVDQETGMRYRRVRPEPGLGRGELDVDAWVPLALGGGTALFALAVLGNAAFRSKRRR